MEARTSELELIFAASSPYGADIAVTIETLRQYFVDGLIDQPLNKSLWRTRRAPAGYGHDTISLTVMRVRRRVQYCSPFREPSTSS